MQKLKQKITFIICFLSLVVVFCFQGAKEYEAKAAFIYNFTKFVEWKNTIQNNNDFTIGVVGESSIYKPLQSIANQKKIDNKLIKIVKFQNQNDIKNCQILFLPEIISEKNAKDIINANRDILIITEKKGSLDYGSGINFLIIDNKIKFEINLNSLNKCNVKASSQLLKLASNVQN